MATRGLSAGNTSLAGTDHRAISADGSKVSAFSILECESRQSTSEFCGDRLSLNKIDEDYCVHKNDRRRDCKHLLYTFKSIAVEFSKQRPNTACMTSFLKSLYSVS